MSRDTLHCGVFTFLPNLPPCRPINKHTTFVLTARSLGNKTGVRGKVSPLYKVIVLVIVVIRTLVSAVE